jgi:hypothetical protein
MAYNTNATFQNDEPPLTGDTEVLLGINGPSSVKASTLAGTVPFTLPGATTARSNADRAKDIGISVLDYGADPTGVSDSTKAIQSALSAGKHSSNRRVILPTGRYKTTAPLLIGQHQVLRGESQVDGGSEIWFYGRDGENCIQFEGEAADEKSKCEIVGIRIVDKRTSPTSGCGISLENVDNRTFLEKLFVRDFPQAQIYVGAPSGKAGDCVQIRDVWVSSALVGCVGIKLERVENSVVLDTIYADIKNGDAINVSNIANDNAAISINNVKHEANLDAYSSDYATVKIGETHGNILLSNVCQRNKTGTGCDIIQITNSAGARLQMLNVFGDQHSTASMEPFTVRTVAPFAQTIHGRIDYAMLGVGGRIIRKLAGNDTPEGNVYGLVGELYSRLDGGVNTALYFKGSGDNTTTGWLRVPGFIAGSTTIDIPSIADGDSYSFDIAVPGAAVGDQVVVGAGGYGNTLGWSANVSASGNVKVVVNNNTGSAIDPSSQTVNVKVFK